MRNPSNIRSEIQKLILDNRLKDAFHSLHTKLQIIKSRNSDGSLTEDISETERTLIILSSQYTSLHNSVLKKSLSAEDERRESNDIVDRLLRLLDVIPDLFDKVLDDHFEDEAWQEAQNLNTVEAYNEYFETYQPDIKYKKEYENAIKKLMELDEKKRLRMMVERDLNYKDQRRTAAGSKKETSAVKVDRKVNDQSRQILKGSKKRSLMKKVAWIPVLLLMVLAFIGMTVLSKRNTTDSFEVEIRSIILKNPNSIAAVVLLNKKFPKEKELSQEQRKRIGEVIDSLKNQTYLYLVEITENDTLTITEQLEEVTTQMSKLEKNKIALDADGGSDLRAKIGQLKQVLRENAHPESEDQFVTCRDVRSRKPYGKTTDFKTSSTIWFWAQIQAPRSERVRIEWLNSKGETIDSGRYHISKNERDGYRIYDAKGGFKPGSYEVRLFNEKNHLIGRKKFSVTE